MANIKMRGIIPWNWAIMPPPAAPAAGAPSANAKLNMVLPPVVVSLILHVKLYRDPACSCRFAFSGAVAGKDVRPTPSLPL
ncbi:hypothetical protein GMLC_27550 [Geomonas limicola]|uniref:Uncharacterized protein n=1 Tax=Geomonas limicola TaxID=2740186 RepID=A0A6V8N9B3_9BACT|nr:hypothetical protein GMLC_27550 [Geomonas limicola]